MKRTQKFSFKSMRGHVPMLRAVGVLGVIGVLVTGVTFSVLQSQQATLTGNTISSASADLRIGTSASTFSASRTGFSFQDIVPGGPAMPVDGYTFYLKNYGTAPLAIKAAIGSIPVNASNVDLSKVTISLTRTDGSAQQAQTATLQALVDGGTAMVDPILPSAVAQYKLRVSMAADAFTGTGASISGIDLVFSGGTTAN